MYSYYTIISYLLLLLVIIGLCMYIKDIKNKNSQVVLIKDEQKKIPLEWNTRTKSFDSESSMPRSLKYLAEPDKCFDCTNQVASSIGTEYAIYEQPTKLFSMGRL
jgi:hypothetical protein